VNTFILFDIRLMPFDILQHSASAQGNLPRNYGNQKNPLWHKNTSNHVFQAAIPYL
jgi:hypothetical protein